MSQVHVDSGIFPITPHFLTELKNNRNFCWLSCLWCSTFQALQMSFWAWFPHEKSLEMPFRITRGFSFTISCQQSKILGAGASSTEDFGTDEQMTEISLMQVKHSRVKTQKLSSDTCRNINSLTLSSLHYIIHKPELTPVKIQLENRVQTVW